MSTPMASSACSPAPPRRPASPCISTTSHSGIPRPDSLGQRTVNEQVRHAPVVYGQSGPGGLAELVAAGGRMSAPGRSRADGHPPPPAAAKAPAPASPSPRPPPPPPPPPPHP